MGYMRLNRWGNEKLAFEEQRQKELVKNREISTAYRQLHAKLQLSEC